jgi:glutamyl-tRNA synthetase
MLPFRIMLVGGKFGPGVFEIIQSIELKDAKERIEYSLKLLSNK